MAFNSVRNESNFSILMKRKKEEKKNQNSKYEK